MRKIRVTHLNALVLLLISPSAYALHSSDTIQVQITGQIVAPSCTANVGQLVDLGTVISGDLSVPGANSQTKFVKLTLTNCSPELNHITATFTGTPYSEDPAFADAIYANESSNGTQGIGLQLFNWDGQPLVNLANGVSYQFSIDGATGSGELPIGARMYTPHGNPTAGSFSASVTVNFTYQ